MSSPIVRWFCIACCLLLAVSAPAAAQCFMPDNLEGPVGSCCTPTQANLPAFPALFTDALDICWQACGVSQTQVLAAEWTAPQLVTTPPTCTYYKAKLTLRDSALSVVWTGPMRLAYSRTWIELGTTGTTYQVWRFLVNGDLSVLPAAGAPPCPVPPCAPAFGNRVRFSGYIDYALDCGTGAFEYAWMLNHDCDRLDHASGFPRSGNFHPDRSYTFVGPAAFFTASTAVPVEAGVSTFEAVRRLDLPVPGTMGLCYFEEPLTNTQVNPLQQGCLCPLSATPTQYVSSDLRVFGSCGTMSFPIATFPYRFLSKALGGWTNPASYPGVEDLRWNTGGYTYTDCTGVTTNELFMGVTTLGGFTAFQVTTAGPGAPLPLTFVDQGNALRYPALTPLKNTPYVTNRFLNLNF
jgi:hypothetical protein